VALLADAKEFGAREKPEIVAPICHAESDKEPKKSGETPSCPENGESGLRLSHFLVSYSRMGLRQTGLVLTNYGGSSGR